MTISRKLLGGVLAVATGAMIGCSSAPLATLNSQTGAANPASNPAPAAQSETQRTEVNGYSVQQYGGGFRHYGSRCRWYWVPSNWGMGYGYDRYNSYWDSGRWQLICNERAIPYWWHVGPYATYGRFPGGYDRTPPRFRPRFNREHFDRDGRRRGGMGEGRGPGPGGMGEGRGPGPGGMGEGRGPGPGGMGEERGPGPGGMGEGRGPGGRGGRG